MFWGILLNFRFRDWCNSEILICSKYLQSKQIDETVQTKEYKHGGAKPICWNQLVKKMMKPCCTTDGKIGQTVTETRAGENSSSSLSLVFLAASVKMWVVDRATAEAADEASSSGDHSVLLGSIMVVFGYVTSTRWNVRKTENVTHAYKNDLLNNCIQLLHELIIKSTDFHSRVATTTRTWACSHSPQYLLKHIVDYIQDIYTENPHFISLWQTNIFRGQVQPNHNTNT